MSYRSRNSSSRPDGSHPQSSVPYFQESNRSTSSDYAKFGQSSGTSMDGGGGGMSSTNPGNSTTLPDDSKISSILRQLKRMVIQKQDQTAINELFEKLRQRIWDVTNKGYIYRSFDTIADDVVCLLQEVSKRMQPQVVHLFACIGYQLDAANSNGFQKYLGFIMAKGYPKGGSNPSSVDKYIRVSLLESLRETLISLKCNLSSEVATKVIRTLKEIMENADVEGFLCISDCLEELAQTHPGSFRRYFKDVVDIIIGWHLEIDRSGELKTHCGRVLQNLGALWTRELEFTQDLVVQVKEDIEASEGDAVHKTQFGCYLGAFNTILKCVSLSGEFCLDPGFLYECCTTVMTSIGNVMMREDGEEWHRGFDILVNANEFMILTMDSGICSNQNHGDNYDDHSRRCLQFVFSELDLLPSLTEEQSASVVYMITKMIPMMVTEHPDMIQQLYKGCPGVLQKRFCKGGILRSLLIDLYQNVLNLKNVQMLKHIYTEMVKDLEDAVRGLQGDNETSVYTPEQSRLVIVFILNCLTKLAMDNTSIIALYACQPSLLEVFVNILQPQKEELWKALPEMHVMVINIIYLHCRQNKNFSMSSSLLKGTKESPTCGHFEIILQLLVDLLDMHNVNKIGTDMVIDWICELVADAKGNDHLYDANENWQEIGKRLIESSKITVSHEMILKLGKFLEQIVQLPTFVQYYAEDIAELCCQRIDSTSSEISGLYIKILGGLPLNVCLNKSLTFCSTPSHVDAYWRAVVYGNRSESDVWPCHFAELFKVLTITSKAPENKNGRNENKEKTKSIEDAILECFNKCRLAADEQFVELAMANTSLLVGWMQWEMAKFCVNNKLKTPLGKAQDTFLHIEGLIRNIARVADGKEVMRFTDAADVTGNQVKSRVIMGIVEALEKCIYNAAEGTAYSYPVLEKPIKAFFKLNATTCSEWFKRNRIPIEVVGGEMMDSDMVVRNAGACLRIIGRDCPEEVIPVMEQHLVALVRAYLRLGDSHSMLGLFSWTKKRFAWIKTAADQTNNQFETAGQSYLVLLVTEEMSKVVKDFVAEQMFECFCATGNYEELTPYLHVEEYKEMIKRIVPQFKEGDSPEVTSRLSNWDQVTHQSSKTERNLQFSIRNTINSMESSLIGATGNPLKLDRTITHDSMNVLIKEAFRTKSEELLPDLLIFQHAYQKIVEKHQQMGRSPDITSFAIDKCFGSKYLNKALTWAQMLHSGDIASSAVVTNIQMDLISVARKEKNLDLASRQLEQYFSTRLVTNERIELENIPRLLIEKELPQDIWTEDMVRASFEASKLLHCSVESRDKSVKLLSHINLMIASDHQGPEAQVIVSEQLQARMLLKIADCIGQKEDDLLSKNKEGPMQELLSSLDDFTSIGHFNSDSVVPLPEISVGKLLAHTVKLCPSFSKSWCVYGNWCYKWGRKIIELSHSKKHKSSLQYDYNMEIKRIVPNIKPTDVTAIINILDEVLMVDNDNDDISTNDSDAEKVAVATLKTLACLTKASKEQVIEVVGVWHKANRHIYGCYEMAANAYFKFLQMDNAEEENLHQHTVMITLRLLRLIVKHALSLQDVLDSGLATTPTGPWKTIIPQLFSRLNHHELFVRKRVSELLCRIAKDAPHIIIFPAVVGCGQGNAGDVSNLLVAAPPIDRGEGVADSRELLACFQALVSTLSKQASDTVAQVQVLVRELQRIGLLWDELWLVALTRVYADFNKKMQFVEKCTGSKECSSADKKVVAETMNQFKLTLLATIEKLDSITGGVADTKNEVMFQTKYKKHVENLKQAAKGNDVTAKSKESKVWSQFKSLYGILHQRASRRSASTLRMEDISPVLFNLKDTVISMPGVTKDGERIYIKSVTNSVQILPTKTRPKKLAFIGDDNRQYNYLFKGLEDLHLDERIMQFLSISNTIMRKASQKIAFGYDYRARHYSVIPLGTQSGLINWVDGVVPIFSLYKKWQQRELAKAKKPTDVKDAAVMRPSELFYSKITPLLAEHKLDVTDNRKMWPVSVLRQALDELVKETPKDLLAKEFWCNSTTTAGWRKTVKNYSLSVAVMSVIGYIIGLGDRHLDNVLVDVSTGEILHIDYNVCFEKGKTLRVPEKIPFRMTQNFQEALGLTGIEGTFRLTCETVLQSLKKGRETLLTLLEAFVYDPLVDWAVNEEEQVELATKGNKREGKVQTTNAAKANADNLQSSSGLKQQWKTSRDEIQKSNYALEECKRHMVLKLQQKQLIASDLMSHHRDLEMISSCTIDQCQILAMKYDTYHALQTAVQTKCDWATQVISVHDDFFARFEDTDLVQLVGRFQSSNLPANATVFEFESIHPIFVAANHLSLYAKSHDLALEMTTSVMNVGQTVQQVYDLFGQYRSSVVSQLPKANNGTHFLCQFRLWCEVLIGGFNAFDLSVAQCQMIVNEIRYGGAMGGGSNAMAVTSHAHNLMSAIQDLSMQHQMLSFDEGGGDTGDAETRYHMAREVVLNAAGEKEKENRDRVCYLNYTVLWELHKKYNMILNSDLSKLRYEMALNSFLFYKHAKLMEEVGVVSNENMGVAQFKLGLDALEQTSNVYEWMHEIKYKFSEEVIPWSVQAVFTGDTDVIEMITKILQCYPNGEIKELEMALKKMLEAVATGGVTNETPVTQAVTEIKSRLADLYKSYANEKHMGAKIFKRFYELFNTFEQRFKEVMETLMGTGQRAREVEISNPLTKALLTNRSALELLKQLYVVKKVDALIEFFMAVMNNLRAFQGNSNSVDVTVYNDQALFNPFKMYINDFLYSVMFPIGDHCQSLILHGLMAAISGGNFTLIDDFVGHCEWESTPSSAHGNDPTINMCLFRDMTVYWEKSCKRYYIQRMVQGQEMEIKRLHSMLKLHEWMNEDIYQAHNLQTDNVLTRSKFLLQSRSLLQQLHGWNATIVKMRQELSVLGEQIKHDLQWADTMFKPLIANYENQAAAKEKALNVIQACSQSTIEVMEQVINYETLRKVGVAESFELSRQMIELLEQIMIMCAQGVGLQPMESRIVEMGPPVAGHEAITTAWKEAILEKLQMAMQQLSLNDAKVESEISAIEANVRQETHQLLKFVPGLQMILVEVQKLTNPSGERGCILSKYTRCMDVVSSGLQEMANGQAVDRLKAIETIGNFNDIIACLKRTMVELKLDDDVEVVRTIRAKGEQAQQPKQNSYAVTVWRRVRMKLEGRDPDASKRMSVEDQVEWMIKEATNRDNLAVLYEGWTPWV